MLKNDLIFLRALEPDDIGTIFNWENDTELWSYGSTTAPFSRHQIWEYLKTYSADIYAQRQLRLMICLAGDGTPVGMIDLFDFEPRHSRAAIGLMIDRRHQRKGIAWQTLHLLIEYARDTLHLHQIYACITTDNVASTALFRKAGFSETATMADWVKTPSGYVSETVFQLILR